MIRHVNILIGSACNLKCGYCLQSGERSPADHKADEATFARRLSEVLRDEPIQRISYWGGEPMLYWKRIRLIHSILKANGVVPADKSIITTNGRRLSEDYVRYANAHSDIWTVVSCHDGEFTDAQLDKIFELKHFSMSELIHSKRTDLWELRDWYWRLKERYGVAPRLCTHFLRATDGCSKDYYMSRSDIDTFCAHVKDVVRMARMGDEWALWQCDQLLFERNRIRRKSEGPLCQRAEQISVDMHGNLYECHHNYSASNISGNLFHRVIPIVREGTYKPDRFYKTSKCQTCEILDECRGGCYCSNTHEEDCYFAKERSKLYRLMEKVLR